MPRPAAPPQCAQPVPQAQQQVPARPPISNQAVNSATRAEPARPTTPLRSIDDIPTDVLMDDSFDAEFFPSDESFFEGIDQAGVV